MDELTQAKITIQKLRRDLKLANLLIERNRVAADARDNLSSLVERKNSELETYMKLLLENCPDIILLFDGSGRLVYCTDVFLKAVGAAGSGLVAGKHYTELLGRFIDREFSVGAPLTFHQTIDFSGGSGPRAYTIQVSPMKDEAGRNNGAMILFYDTTDLLKAMSEAEKANQAKSDFLATVSHEIRTPMNAIIGITSMLGATNLSAEQRNFVKNIRNSSDVLLNLINDILDFSKIEAGKLELICDYFSLPGLLRGLKEMFDLLFPEKNLSFDCGFAEDLPEVVYGDEKRIRQIMTNLLNNALKYTKQGGVVFHARAEGAGGEAVVSFTVEDTGIGIREEALPRLFMAFEQLDQVRNKQVQGTGLGLVITKRLCAMMNGEITVRSEYGKGSVFTVRLPLMLGSAADLRAEELTVVPFTAAKASVLLVDDIEINLEVASYMLESYGITADRAAGGRESIEMAALKRYDLILMDHMMPGMDGIEAVRVIRSGGSPNAATPVIALTANAVSGAREMFLGAGFNGFLSKPIDNRSLAEILLRWLPEKVVEKA